ncbi:MAG: ribonuclease HII, partial [Verrucomicrobia bacterium]|nr:ribonuclease HII [Verrucomicrobiota bacterium]
MKKDSPTTEDAPRPTLHAPRPTPHASRPTRSCRPSYRFERAAIQRGAKIVAGVDEAGRGPLAGPVVAAAVVLPVGLKLTGLNDSKQLTAEQRDEFFQMLTTDGRVQFGVGVVDVEWIDRLNILQATHRAMIEALRHLPVQPDHVLVDGRPVKTLPYPQTALVKGDARSFSIAAASVIAKVTRDRLMMDLHAQYPVYGFDQHKGYPTPMHLLALHLHGPSPVHRRTFGPVRGRL